MNAAVVQISVRGTFCPVRWRGSVECRMSRSALCFVFASLLRDLSHTGVWFFRRSLLLSADATGKHFRISFPRCDDLPSTIKPLLRSSTFPSFLPRVERNTRFFNRILFLSIPLLRPHLPLSPPRALTFNCPPAALVGTISRHNASRVSCTRQLQSQANNSYGVAATEFKIDSGSGDAFLVVGTTFSW